MKKYVLLIAGMSILAISCGRKEPSAVAEQPAGVQPTGVQPAQTPVPLAAVTPAAPPVRESSWKPAPVRTAEKAVTPAPVRRSAPKTVTVAAGTVLPVRIGATMSSEKNQAGDPWSGVLAEPLVIDGVVVAERGAQVEGRVTDVQRAGRVKGVAQIRIALNSFTSADGQEVSVQTGSFAARGKDETKKDAAKVAIGAGVGAAIGAIAGKGKGAAIGAGAGAAAGTGAVLATRGGPAQIPTEALVRFRVTNPVTITEKLR